MWYTTSNQNVIRVHVGHERENPGVAAPGFSFGLVVGMMTA